MHASRILRQCLCTVLEPMHAARSRRLLAAVEALVSGGRLTLTDLARSWPGATWVHAPLKALDRLLSNRQLHRAVLPFQQAMSNWPARCLLARLGGGRILGARMAIARMAIGRRLVDRVRSGPLSNGQLQSDQLQIDQLQSDQLQSDQL